MFKRKKTAKSYRFYRKKSKKKKSFKFLDIGIAFLGILTILFVLSSLKRLTQTQAEGNSRVTPLRIQVLNASGSKLEPEVIEQLKKKSVGAYYLTIVELKDLNDSPIKETLLLDRKKDRKLARLVGEKLGVKRDNIESQELEDNYLDLNYTLILGQDYHKLFKLTD
jgi:hypothetical protein